MICENYTETPPTGIFTEFEYGKMQEFGFCLKIFFSKTTEQNSKILHTNSLWICVNLVCSNGGATYIIGKLMAKDNLNIENLMPTCENLIFKVAQQNS